MNQCTLPSLAVRLLCCVGVFEAILDMDQKGVDIGPGIATAGANLEAIDICVNLAQASVAQLCPQKSDIRCIKWNFISLSGFTEAQLGRGHLAETFELEYLSASGGSSSIGMRCAAALASLSTKTAMSRWTRRTDRQTDRVSHGQQRVHLMLFQSTNLVGVDVDLELERGGKRDKACLAPVLWCWWYWRWWCGHNWNHGSSLIEMADDLWRLKDVVGTRK